MQNQWKLVTRGEISLKPETLYCQEFSVQRTPIYTFKRKLNIFPAAGHRGCSGAGTRGGETASPSFYPGRDTLLMFLIPSFSFRSSHPQSHWPQRHTWVVGSKEKSTFRYIIFVGGICNFKREFPPQWNVDKTMVSKVAILVPSATVHSYNMVLIITRKPSCSTIVGLITSSFMYSILHAFVISVTDCWAVLLLLLSLYCIVFWPIQLQSC